jgi:hypothetical protein
LFGNKSENQIDWFYLVEGKYQTLPVNEDGIIRSVTFPGLWLAIEALLNNDMVRVLQTLQLGLNSPEHRDFVEKLEKK